MCGPDSLGKRYLAHSARPEQDIPAQDYAAHVKNVHDACIRNIRGMFPSGSQNTHELDAGYSYYVKAAVAASSFHDLGKLAEQNQKVLRGEKKARSLPIHHQDAGVLYMMQHNLNFAALMIYAHHIGLPNMTDVRVVKQGKRFRDFSDNGITAYDSDENLAVYVKLHSELLGGGYLDTNIAVPDSLKNYELSKNFLFTRLLFSCLVDADHSDTAVNYGELEEKQRPALRAADRLAVLDKYVAKLAASAKGKPSERNIKRSEMYSLTRDSQCSSTISYCDSPVGTGKTTAVTAYLLNTAAKNELRRIFVVLPFINILNQTVRVLREALRLPGESEADMKNVVAAIHHRAEYDNENDRRLSSLWRAPIIVTTAVQFFETMAGAAPARLRKLHELPGSAVFIDEAHTALPIGLWPTAWRWITQYADTWRCHFVLASGTTTKFWTLEEIAEKKQKIVPPLLPNDFRRSLNDIEISRVQFRRKIGKIDEDEVCDFILSLKGPRLVILNTVQSAAVIAKKLQDRCGENSVMHLSTSLTPDDRSDILDKVKKRLENSTDSDWTLVATSCVEAGVDFSFRNGVREAAGFVNLLQMAGRIRRNEEKCYEDSVVWTIELATGGMLKKHPVFKYSSHVLSILFDKDEKLISKGQDISEMCRKALKDELGMMVCKPGKTEDGPLRECEIAGSFAIVQKRFNVIDSESVTVLIDEGLKLRLEAHEKVSWQEIQDSSVQIFGYSAAKLGAIPIAASSELYFWPYKYDKFIGYMAGVLENAATDMKGCAFL